MHFLRFLCRVSPPCWMVQLSSTAVASHSEAMAVSAISYLSNQMQWEFFVIRSRFASVVCVAASGVATLVVLGDWSPCFASVIAIFFVEFAARVLSSTVMFACACLLLFPSLTKVCRSLPKTALQGCMQDKYLSVSGQTRSRWTRPSVCCTAFVGHTGYRRCSDSSARSSAQVPRPYRL